MGDLQTRARGGAAVGALPTGADKAVPAEAVAEWVRGSRHTLCVGRGEAHEKRSGPKRGEQKQKTRKQAPNQKGGSSGSTLVALGGSLGIPRDSARFFIERQ